MYTTSLIATFCQDNASKYANVDHPDARMHCHANLLACIRRAEHKVPTVPEPVFPKNTPQ